MSRFKGTKINPKYFDRSQLKYYIILVPIGLFMVLPIVYIFSQAFKPLDELLLYPPRFFVNNPTWKNFRDLFRTASSTGVPMSRYFFNSIVIAIVMVVTTVFLSTLTGYVLSKKKFRLKNTLLSINQLALMFVPIAVSIPRYIVVKEIGLTNNFFAHILPYLAMPVGLFLIKQFIDGVPNELLEAARIDGANDLQILTKIVMPLVKPAMATVAILTFQSVWSNVEPSNIYIQDETMKSFAFYLNALANQQNVIAGAGMAAAASLILFIPNLVIFIFMQSKVMNTMSHSGIK
ncbi:MAG TPA: carbohydrate ABC transporter permease [Haloplasmataceae bacterium]